MIAFLAMAMMQAPACLPIAADSDRPVSLTGRLIRRTYRSVASGRRETVHVLLLDRPMCIDDGSAGRGAISRFGRVHVFSGEARVRASLSAANGRRVRIGGSGFAAHTAHHYEPLVVNVATVRVVRR